MRALLFISDPNVASSTLAKARGWWGPLHSGTHVKRTAHKEGEDGGGGGRGRALSVTLPDSSHIETDEQAKAYWRAHFAGKVIHLTVHSAKNSKPPIRIKVRFDAANNHAFSSDVGGKNKAGVREFDVKRAMAMNRILSTIEFPKTRSRNHSVDLLFERNIGNEHFTVVLTWKSTAGVYEFNSSHFKSALEVGYLWAHQDRRKNEGPLQKSRPSSVFPELQAPLSRGTPLGVHLPLRKGNGSTVTNIPKPLKKSIILFFRKRNIHIV